MFEALTSQLTGIGWLAAVVALTIVCLFLAYFGLYLGARVISLAFYRSKQQIHTQTKAKEADNGV